MSKYIYNLSASLERALAGVPTAPPGQVAGYWANRDFWLSEFDHLLSVIAGFEGRLQRMDLAYDWYVRNHPAKESRDEFGTVGQRPKDPTSGSQRRGDASDARTALKVLADRSLDLNIAKPDEYEAFIRRLRISGR